MQTEIKQKWCEALRSDKYKQGMYALRNSNDEYCCLGVLCDIIDRDGWELLDTEYRFKQGDVEKQYVPTDLAGLIGLSFSQQLQLTGLNDIQRKNFKVIANYIENNF